LQWDVCRENPARGKKQKKASKRTPGKYETQGNNYFLLTGGGGGGGYDLAAEGKKTKQREKGRIALEN